MKKINISFLIFPLLLILIVLSADYTTPVNIETSSFNPSNTDIEATDIIIWINSDTKIHHIVSDDGLFDSGELRPGQNYSFKFRSAGLFKYHDALDPTLKGSIRVWYPPMQ